MEHGLGQLEWGYVSFWFLRWLDILKPARDFTCVCNRCESEYTHVLRTTN